MNGEEVQHSALAPVPPDAATRVPDDIALPLGETTIDSVVPAPLHDAESAAESFADNSVPAPLPDTEIVAESSTDGVVPVPLYDAGIEVELSIEDAVAAPLHDADTAAESSIDGVPAPLHGTEALLQSSMDGAVATPLHDADSSAHSSGESTASPALHDDYDYAAAQSLSEMSKIASTLPLNDMSSMASQRTEESVMTTPGDMSSAVPAASTDVPDVHDPAPSAGETRRRLVAQFETWLDRMAAGEPPPDGLPPEILAEAQGAQQKSGALESDLYTLFASLTTLSGEIRLQGRAFKQLTDTLGPVTQVPGRMDRMEAGHTRIAQELSRQWELAAAEAEDDAGMPGAKDVLAVLFDLYDRLERGLRTFDTHVKGLQSGAADGGWRERWFGNKARVGQLLASTEAVRDGYALTVSRLEAALRQWGIQRTGEAGEMFDPRRMAAMDVQPAEGVADGTVLEVLRNGYMLHGEVLSTAQVKVARATGPRE